MPEKKKSEQPRKNKPGSRARKPVANIELGDISNVTGSVSVAAGNIVNHINNIQSTLTPGEVSEKDLQIEINELAQGVQNYLERLKGQALHDKVPSPYKGLDAYSLSDAGAFFGRDQAIHELREALKRSPLTILQAESGAGKTSMLQAGLIPRLMAEEHLAIWLRPQFDNPSVTLKKQFIGNLNLTPKLAGTPLVDFLRRITGMIGVQTTLYVILDQFEEFFSKHTPEEDRQAFIHDLAGCLNDSTLNVRWVISITTDAFGQLGKLEPHIKNPFSNVQSLYLLNRGEAAEVIAKPAQLHALTFQDGLLDQLLDDLGQQQNVPIAPTQIQLVCLALYEDLREQDRVFTLAQYEQKGGAAGILHGYVENVLGHHLPPDERAPAYKILEELVTSEKKRIIRGKTDLETALQNKGISHALAESTLNHLVNRRLLRQLGDNQEQVQFEIVHDYLLREIEINDDVRNAKEAEEMLDQGLKSWERHKLLLAPDVLKILEARAVDHLISSAAAKLLFLSAIEYNRPAERWGELISAEDQKDLIAALLASKSNRKNREALWSLHRHLPKPQRTNITLVRSALIILAFIQKGILVVLVGAALIGIGAIGVNLSLHFVPWREVTGLNSQCLDGNASNLLVAIDAMNKSHVIVYDSRSHSLCETQNTGARWTPYSKKLSSDLTINSIAVNSGIYLATDQGLYYQDRDSAWRNAKPTAGSNSAFEKIAVASEDRQIYLSNEHDQLYRYDLTTGNWYEVPTEGITGKITDITVNYDYFAVSTTDGIWFRGINSNGTWVPYDLRENVIITTLEMVHPVRSWEHYFIDPTDDDWFLAVADKGGIYFGYLTESGGLEKMPELPTGAAPVVSLAVHEYSKFVTGPDGLYCEQSWNILDSEWWLRFGKEPPCQ